MHVAAQEEGEDTEEEEEEDERALREERTRALLGPRRGTDDDGAGVFGRR